MRRIVLSLAATFAFVATVVPGLAPTTRAQTQNHSSKTEFTESFVFPNDCTGELMDVTDSTVVTCHDQLRADGTFREKCEIVQFVNAVGESSGITFSGTATFKDEVTATDPCNFSLTNVGGVRLISRGSDVNLILYFDDTIRMENCVMTVDSHEGSFECRGGN
jgi:hypothetical protein